MTAYRNKPHKTVVPSVPFTYMSSNTEKNRTSKPYIADETMLFFLKIDTETQFFLEVLVAIIAFTKSCIYANG